MKRNPFGVETKTAASTTIAAAGTLVLVLNSWLHWFTPPPADVVAAVEAAAVGVAGYFARHTPRPLPPSFTTGTPPAGYASASGAVTTTGTVLPVVSSSFPPDVDVAQGYTTPPDTTTGKTAP